MNTATIIIILISVLGLSDYITRIITYDSKYPISKFISGLCAIAILICIMSLVLFVVDKANYSNRNQLKYIPVNEQLYKLNE